jgi:peroxiredoxin
MDSLKGLFVSLCATFIVFGTLYSSYIYLQNLSDLNWLGNVLSFGIGAVYFAGIFLIATPRTSKNMWSTWVPLVLGTFITLYGTFINSSTTTYFPLILNLTMLVSWFLYTYWATDFSDRNKNTLEIGKKIPSVSFKRPDGSSISIETFLGAPAIFLFYRGNWCPFCMAQMKELAKEYQKIKDQGAALVFVSPQSPKHTKSLAKKFDIPAHFLMDENLEAAKTLQLFHKKGTPRGFEVLGYDSDNVLPTLVVLDKEGIIRFADLTDNYRIRPEPSQYLKLLEQL